MTTAETLHWIADRLDTVEDLERREMGGWLEILGREIRRGKLKRK